MASVYSNFFGSGSKTQRFEESVTFEKRKEEAQRVRQRYPDRIPVICEKGRADANIPELERTKFLVPAELTIGQLVYVIRTRLELAPETALFVYAKDGSALPTGSTLRDVDEQYKADDLFLYISYSGEATFG